MSFGNLSPDLLRKAASVQQNLVKLREDLEDRIVEGTSGGGLVTAFTNGNGELVKISIKPDAIDADDMGMLEDLVVAAVQQSLEESRTLQKTEMDKITGGMSMPGLF